MEDELIAKKMAESLKEAAQVAKDNANAKAPKPDPPSQLVGVGSAADGARGDERSVAGRKKFGGVAGTGGQSGSGSGSGEEQKVVKEVEEESEEDHQIEVELNSILKKSPSKFPSCNFCRSESLTSWQSSFSRNHTAPIRDERKAFYSRSTLSIQRRTL